MFQFELMNHKILSCQFAFNSKHCFMLNDNTICHTTTKRNRSHLMWNFIHVMNWQDHRKNGERQRNEREKLVETKHSLPIQTLKLCVNLPSPSFRILHFNNLRVFAQFWKLGFEAERPINASSRAPTHLLVCEADCKCELQEQIRNLSFDASGQPTDCLKCVKLWTLHLQTYWSCHVPCAAEQK